MYKNRLFTPEESFSSRGFIYGGALALSFPMGSSILRVSPIYLIRTYPHKNLASGWKYYFVNKDLKEDSAIEELQSEPIVAIELGVLL